MTSMVRTKDDFNFGDLFGIDDPSMGGDLGSIFDNGAVSDPTNPTGNYDPGSNLYSQNPYDPTAPLDPNLGVAAGSGDTTIQQDTQNYIQQHGLPPGPSFPNGMPPGIDPSKWSQYAAGGVTAGQLGQAATQAANQAGANGTGGTPGTSGGGSQGGGAQGTTNINNTTQAKTGPSLLDVAPAVLQAVQQFNQAGDITDRAEGYAKTLDPYGAYRDQAAKQLQALQADPSSVTATPGYQFNLSQGLGSVANRDNRSFGVGAGSTNPDMMNFASGLASKTYNDTVTQLQNEAGTSIGPQAAGTMLGQGLTQSVASQNAATAALGSALGSVSDGALSSIPSALQNLFGGATNVPAGVTNGLLNNGLGPALNANGTPTTPTPTTSVGPGDLNQFNTPNQGSNFDGGADPTGGFDLDSNGNLIPKIARRS